MAHIVCVIKGCYGTNTSKHRFPNPSKDLARFKKWLQICDIKELYHTSPSKVYDHRRVCRIHFVEDDFGTNNRLLRTAYPKLHLSGTVGVIPQTSNVTVSTMDLIAGSRSLSTDVEISDKYLTDNDAESVEISSRGRDAVLTNRKHTKRHKIKHEKRSCDVPLGEAQNECVKESIVENDVVLNTDNNILSDMMAVSRAITVVETSTTEVKIEIASTEVKVETAPTEVKVESTKLSYEEDEIPQMNSYIAGFATDDIKQENRIIKLEYCDVV